MIAVFGLGEAGSEIAADLAAHGFSVAAFDPAPVADVTGVRRCPTPADAVVDAHLVLAVTSGADAARALDQALSEIPAGTVYADLSTASPAAKRALSATAQARGLRFVDVALMSTVPGKGLATPSLASGPGAGAYADLLASTSAVIEVVGDEAGLASKRKLLRSVAIKGLAGVLMESLAAAEAAGLRGETWQNLAHEFTAMDDDFLQRLIDGTPRHATRRHHEMVAAVELLEELGVEPTLTRATVAHLDALRALGALGSDA